jgi:nitroreductase
MLLLMELSEVVRRRRMVRNYSPEPVDRAVLDRILTHALHAPSAGFAQGWAFLVLDRPADVARYWQVTAAERLEQPDSWLRGMMTAPVVVVPMSSEAAYRRRYDEPDKRRGASAEQSWPVPYWHLDTAMATLLMLLTATDEGLGACFFGLPGHRTEAFREAFGVPEEFTPIGAMTVGHRVPDTGSPGSAARGRRPLEEVVHRGRW